MNQILPIFKKEFLGYFRSPVGYVILGAFHIVVIGFALRSNYYENSDANLGSVFTSLPWILVVFIPAIGMRLWSEEKRSGSIELLFTLPISPKIAVLGKYAAAMCFICIGLALTFSIALTSSYLGNPDWGIIISGYLGAILTAAAYLSISAICSAMTQNQVIAFVVSVVICFFATLAGSEYVTQNLNWLLPNSFIQFLDLMSFEQHFANMSRGLIDISALSFYITLTIACLGINMVVIED